MRRLTLGLSSLAALLCSSTALAGPIGDENGKPGIVGSWPAGSDGTAAQDGVVDVYPAQWSIKPGDPIALKVRASSAYRVRVMRLGWYGGAGAREVAMLDGRPANPQPYPVADPAFGLAEAKWATTDTIPTDASWVSGVYIARIEQTDGKDAVTFFTIRDDGVQRQPILLVVGTNTHQAYNAWPGPDRGGKSLYGFNSSPVHPTESITDLVQAVKVSYDRPFFVGGGSADLANYEYPMIRWLERNGWDTAYATDLDVHRDPEIIKNRRAVIFSGHEEYTSGAMFDNALAARDSGTNFLFLTGDTWSWQVRFEGQVMVGYKESFVKDPEQRAAVKARDSGDLASAATHFANVSRGWKNLDTPRPGMLLTGVMSAGVIRNASGQPMNGSDYPWGDLFVDLPTFWIYDGTGLQGGDKIPNVFGYEVDSTMRGTPEMDAYRPAGQVKLGTIKQLSDGTAKGAAGYYQKDLGGGKRVEVVSIGAIFFSWALDDWAAKSGGHPSSHSDAAEKMMNNVLKRWTGDAPIPPEGAPPAGSNDPGAYDPEHPAADPNAPPPKSGCNVTGLANTSSSTSRSFAALLGLFFVSSILRRRGR
ncbi:MAG: N,N-dimethylformamidase beta subunit family domain-containing protein [Polyangiales bacterium]